MTYCIADNYQGIPQQPDIWQIVCLIAFPTPITLFRQGLQLELLGY
jgi:hypothetical protein